MNTTTGFVRLTAAIALLFAAATLPALGIPSLDRVRGSGNLEARQFDTGAFTAVDVGYGFEVSIREGRDTRVSITTDDNIFEHLRVEVSGGELTVGLQRGVRINSTRVEIEIVMPDLESVSLSGAASGEIATDRGGEPFDADLSGASSLSGRLRAGTVSIVASGASRVELTGQASELRADVSGASRLRLFEFPVADVEADVSGASTLETTVSDTLEVDASGASTVRYRGEPSQVLADSSGSSTVRRE